MAFSAALSERIRRALARKRGVEEKKMFGGVGFLLHGNMLVGVWKDSLIARLGPDNHDDALLEPHVREFVFEVEGDPVSFLWHVPISDEERAYKQEHGANALIDRMDAVGLPWVFDENNRPLLVEEKDIDLR